MTPSLTRPGANCLIFTIGPRSWYFSYETLIAYSGPNARRGVRREEDVSFATRNHMQSMGVAEWQRVRSEEFWDLSNATQTGGNS